MPAPTSSNEVSIINEDESLVAPYFKTPPSEQQPISVSVCIDVPQCQGSQECCPVVGPTPEDVTLGVVAKGCVDSGNDLRTPCGQRKENKKRKENEKRETKEKKKKRKVVTESLDSCSDVSPVQTYMSPKGGKSKHEDRGDNTEKPDESGVVSGTSAGFQLCCEMETTDNVVVREAICNPDNGAGGCKSKNDKVKNQNLLPHSNGTYILGKLQGLEVAYIVDGGATETLVAAHAYEQMPDDV